MYTFREIKQEEIPQMFDLIQSRVAWMDEVGIRQWNVTNYAEVYPMSYYEGHRQEGEVFVLIDSQEILAVGVLKHEDDRWPQDGENAVYLHNFATKIGKKGIGRIFMQFAEQYARESGQTYFRLDSADDNQKLEAYYTSMGYTPAGTCVDGLYSGILRQKKLI